MTPRIQRLLERALAHDVIPAPVCVEFDPKDETLPEPVRIGKRLAETIAAQPVAIREDEEFVGWLPFDGSVEADLYRRSGHRAFGDLFREWYRKPRENLAIFEWQHTSHASANYDKCGECHMTVGGLRPDGSDGWTDFSRLVVESVLELPLKRPEMSFRWHPGTSRETLRHMLDRERRDAEKRIAFDGDPPRIAAFVRRLGLPVELARDYCITGCNEPTFMGGVSFGGLHVHALRCIATLFTRRRHIRSPCRREDGARRRPVRNLHLEPLRVRSGRPQRGIV